MAGYTRNDTGNNIADGNIINASDLDGEFDAVEAAFNASTGHTHDGTSAEGAPIEKVGPAQDLVITATEVKPKTDNTLDLGTTTLEFKDAFFDGTVKTDTLTVDENATVTGNLTVNGNTTLGNAATDTVTVTADVASDLIPSADGTYDLGASGSEWQDLYIDGTANIDSLVADTADINAGTIDGTIIGGSTPAAGSFTTFTSNGIDDNADATAITIDSDERVLIGHTSAITTQGGPLKLQSIGANVTTGLDIFTGGASALPRLNFTRSRNATPGSNTIVQDGDNLGLIMFMGDDGTDYQPRGAQILAQVDGTPGTNDMPGRLAFYTTSDGSDSATERMRITNDGRVGIGTSSPISPLDAGSSGGRIINLNSTNAQGGYISFQRDGTDKGYLGSAQQLTGGGSNDDITLRAQNNLTFAITATEAMRIDSSQRVLIGHNANINNFPVQLNSTGSAILSLSQYSNDTSAAIMTLHKSRGSTIDSNVLSQDDDNIGIIQFKGNDGSGFHTSAQIECEHDGTTGNNDTPGRLTFLTTADGASSPTERMRINSSGQILQGGASAYTDFYSLFLENSYSGTGQKRSIGTRYGEGSANGPTFDFFKTRSNSNAATTLVNNGDSLGEIRFFGMDGTDAEPGAVIQASVDGTPGSDDMPGRLVFKTTADGASSSTERMRISEDGSVGIGLSDTTSGKTVISLDGVAITGDTDGATMGKNAIVNLFNDNGGTTNSTIMLLGSSVDSSVGSISSGIGFTRENSTNWGTQLRFYTHSTSVGDLDELKERMRLDASGNLLVAKTANDTSIAGFQVRSTGQTGIGVDGGYCGLFNRLSNDGTILLFYQDGSQEGTISVSGTTVSYNGGHLSRWSQLADNTRDESIVKGTVMSNLDQMAEWTTDGVTEDNEQLNCMKVSDTEGDADVAGVFVNWDNDDDIYTNDMNIAMTGDMVIRIAQGTTVARGDLLMSAGDGTAKPQGDDIVRSKTIAKVTSTHVSHTYDDGSYLVPCVLMAC